MIVSISAEGAEEHMMAIRFDINRALQSMAERKLLQYAQSNITINLGDAAVNKADTSKMS